MSPRSEHRTEHHSWVWLYRATMIYTAIIVTVVLILLVKGYS